MRTTVSVRGQTVIPREIRRALDIQAQSKLDWELKDDGIFIRPLPADPVRAAVGLLRGKGLGTAALLEERRRERARERSGDSP
jgi:AbrB family looped-hinge helix DNA binding protein